MRVPTLLIPLWNVHGEIGLYQSRPDEPRIRDGKAVKYETPAGSNVVIDVPPMTRERLKDPGWPLFITEGVKKADSAVSHGLCCIALLGVWNWRGTNESGGKVALADWECIALNERDVFITFDSDVIRKVQVHAALVRLKAFLESRGARVHIVVLPRTPTAKKWASMIFSRPVTTSESCATWPQMKFRRSRRHRTRRKRRSTGFQKAESWQGVRRETASSGYLSQTSRPM